MAKKPGETFPEMSLGNDRELHSVIHRNSPKRLDPALVRYMIDHPLFTQAAIEQFFAELQVPLMDWKWFGMLHIKDGFDANDAAQKLGAVQGKKSTLAMLEEVLAQPHNEAPDHPHEYWSQRPTRAREMRIMMQSRRHRPATPLELVAYISRGWRAQNGRKSLVSLAPFYVDHQPHVLMYSANADGQLCWTIENAERVWPMTTCFLALGAVD